MKITELNIPSPCHIIDLDRLNYNLNNPIKTIREKASCNVFLALKGFSAEKILPYMIDGLDGVSASGAFEAKMGKEIIGKHVCTFSPAYQDHNIATIIAYSDTIVFNSIKQFSKYNSLAYKNECSCGIRINPRYSELPITFGANPCQRYSRLGIVLEDMPPITMFDQKKIEGIHIHTMCDQNAEVLEKTINFMIDNFDKYMKRVRWINLGGGQMYAQDTYDLERAFNCINSLHDRYDADIFLEPCSGIMTNCGYYVTSIVDIIKNEVDIVIVDGSGICHMPDTVYRDWYHDICGADAPGVHPYTYKITGSSCYAGDIFGDYSFPKSLHIGDKIMFQDTAMYSMVKNNTFNGLQMPSLAIYSKQEGLKLLKEYDYDSFLRCQ